jgi:adenine-specific DNA glycosylase
VPAFAVVTLPVEFTYELLAALVTFTVTVQEPLAPIEHGFTHYRLTLHPQPVAVRRWPARAAAPGQAWLLPDDAIAAALPAPIRRLLKDVRAASQFAFGAQPRAHPRSAVRR